MVSSYYRNASGIIIVYDITNWKSFENIEKWIEEINTYCGPNTVLIMVGNKNDL